MASMAERVPRALQPFVTEKVVLLQTRKRDGSWVDTPVNIAVDGDRAYFRTPARASKNKRLRNFPQVRFAACTWLGRATGPPVEATARLLAAGESATAARLINRKHPLLQRLFVPLTHRLLRTETLHYELTDVRPLEET
jgi:PPOX class probable F420-dependent enzyme